MLTVVDHFNQRALLTELEEVKAALSDGPHGPVLVVRGELDVAAAAQFSSAVVDAVRAAHSPAYLDLTGVTFLSSQAVSALIRARKIAEITKVDLVVVPSTIVRRVLDHIGLGDQFHWGSTRDPPAPQPAVPPVAPLEVRDALTNDRSRSPVVIEIRFSE